MKRDTEEGGNVEENTLKYYRDHYDVIVIGCSLAGMSAAMKLASQGKSVLIRERHNLPFAIFAFLMDDYFTGGSYVSFCFRGTRKAAYSPAAHTHVLRVSAHGCDSEDLH